MRGFGPAALILSALIASTALAILRLASPDAEVRLAVLGAGSLLSGSFFLLPKFYRTSNLILNKSDRKDWLWVVLWSACYCVAYGLFTWYRNEISLSGLIVAQSLAPIAAVFITRRKEDVLSLRELYGVALSVSLLMALAWVNGHTGESSGNSLSWVIFLTVLISFLGSNTAARVITSRQRASWIQPRLAVLNGVVLLLITSVVSRSIGLSHLGGIVLMGLATGVGILSTQWLFMVGLQKSSPFIAALCISMAVPISIGIDALIGLHRISIGEGILSVLFCGSVLLNQKIARGLRQKIGGVNY